MDLSTNVVSLLMVGSVIYVSTLVVLKMYTFSKMKQQLKCFPSPEGHWLFGNALRGFKSLNYEFLKLALDRVQKFNHVFVIWISKISATVVLVHPETIKPVLKYSDPKSWQYASTLQPWLGEGLLIAKDMKWSRSRRLLTPAFHFNVLKPYIDVYQECANTFMQKIESPEAQKNGFDLFGEVSLLTLDIILQCAFTNKTGCQTMGKRHPYIQAVYDLGILWQRRVIALKYTLFPWLYPFSKEGKEFAKLCSLVHDEADKVIEKRKRELEESNYEIMGTKRSIDFLDILLTAQDEHGNKMSKEDIRAEVDTFLFEGHDTTASGLSWTLYLLAKHPEYQKQAQEEIDELFEGKDDTRMEWQDLNKIPYSLQCLKEAMRLYPPVPMFGRTPRQDIETPYGTIPANSNCTVNVFALHHNPSVWGDDHMEYNPERMSTENLRTMDPFAYIPFSAGPRNCIGQNFALNEEKVVLACLLHRYEFTLRDNDEQVYPQLQIVLRSEKPVYLMAKLRKH